MNRYTIRLSGVGGTRARIFDAIKLVRIKFNCRIKKISIYTLGGVMSRPNTFLRYFLKSKELISSENILANITLAAPYNMKSIAITA
jgi:hypothetical protein